MQQWMNLRRKAAFGLNRGHTVTQIMCTLQQIEGKLALLSLLFLCS